MVIHWWQRMESCAEHPHIVIFIEWHWQWLGSLAFGQYYACCEPIVLWNLWYSLIFVNVFRIHFTNIFKEWESWRNLYHFFHQLQFVVRWIRRVWAAYSDFRLYKRWTQWRRYPKKGIFTWFVACKKKKSSASTARFTHHIWKRGYFTVFKPALAITIP